MKTIILIILICLSGIVFANNYVQVGTNIAPTNNDSNIDFNRAYVNEIITNKINCNQSFTIRNDANNYGIFFYQNISGTPEPVLSFFGSGDFRYLKPMIVKASVATNLRVTTGSTAKAQLTTSINGSFGNTWIDTVNDRINIYSEGFYYIIWATRWHTSAATGTGYIRNMIYKNGTNIAEGQRYYNGTYTTGYVFTLAHLYYGDYIEGYGYQAIGADLNLVSANGYSNLTLIKVA